MRKKLKIKSFFFSINYNSEKLIDVTIPLQFLVKDHSLQVVTDQTKVSIIKIKFKFIIRGFNLFFVKH